MITTVFIYTLLTKPYQFLFQINKLCKSNDNKLFQSKIVLLCDKYVDQVNKVTLSSTLTIPPDCML